MLTEAESRIRNVVAIIKRHPKYTAQIGEEMGVVAAEPMTTIPADVKPEYQVTIFPDMVRFDWSKLYFDCIIIESKRGSETVFTKLDKDTRSPFEDKRPNLVAGVPETRIYRLRYLIGDEQVGQWTEEIKVVVLI